MEHPFRVFRVEYLASSFVPLFAAAIIFNKIIPVILLVGLSLLGIGLNIHNDLCDNDLRSWSKKDLVRMAVCATLLGLLLLVGTPILNTIEKIIAIVYVILYALYNMKLQDIPILSALIVIPGSVLPIIFLKVYNLPFILAFSFMGLSVYSLHQMLHGEAVLKLKNYWGEKFSIFTGILSSVFLIVFLLTANIEFTYPVILTLLPLSAFVFKCIIRRVKKYGEIKVEGRKFHSFVNIANLYMVFLIAIYLSLNL